MSFSRRQKRVRSKLQAAPVASAAGEGEEAQLLASGLADEQPMDHTLVTRLSSSEDEDDGDAIVAFLDGNDSVNEGVGARKSKGSEDSAVLSKSSCADAPSPGSSVISSRLNAKLVPQSDLNGRQGLSDESDDPDDSDSEDDAIARSILSASSNASDIQKDQFKTMNAGLDENITQRSPLRPTRAASRIAREKIGALAESSDEDSEDDIAAASRLLDSPEKVKSLSSEKNSPTTRGPKDHADGAENAVDEWKPTSEHPRKGHAKKARDGAKKRGPGESSKGLKLPFGGLLSQELFLKILSHARKTQEFSQLDVKDITKERHQLPSWCFLSIYESAERMGQLQRRFPFCDESGLIHRDLVQKIRKEIRRFKKTKDLAKRQESPFHQTPYTSATSAAGLLPDATNALQLSNLFASLLLSRANKLFDVIWEGTVPAIVLDVRGENLSDANADAAASILDRAWFKMNAALVAEAEATASREWLKEWIDSRKMASRNRGSDDSESEPGSDSDDETQRAIMKTTNDPKEEQANILRADDASLLSQLDEKEKHMKECAISEAKAAATIMPIPPALAAAAKAALDARRAERDAAIAAAAGVENSNDIQANEALRDFLAPSDLAGGLSKAAVSPESKSATSSNKSSKDPEVKTISKSNLLQKMMSRRAKVVTLSTLEATTLRESEVRKVTEREAARTRKVIEDLSGKGKSKSAVQEDDPSSTSKKMTDNIESDNEDGEMELEASDDFKNARDEKSSTLHGSASNADAQQSKEAADNSEQDGRGVKGRDEHSNDDSINRDGADDVPIQIDSCNNDDVDNDDEKEDDDDDGLLFVDVSPERELALKRTLRQTSGDVRVRKALDMCVENANVRRKKKVTKKVVPSSHRRSVMSRLKKSLGESKLKAHAQRNGFHSMDHLRRAEQREVLAKAQEEAQRLERERMENIILGDGKLGRSQLGIQEDTNVGEAQSSVAHEESSFGDNESSDDEEMETGHLEKDSSKEVFIASSTFEGAKVGMVFKSGPKGVGYYSEKVTIAETSNEKKAGKESSEVTPELINGEAKVTKSVLKTRIIEETVEDEFGFPVTKIREETYEDEVESLIKSTEGKQNSTENAPSVQVKNEIDRVIKDDSETARNFESSASSSGVISESDSQSFQQDPVKDTSNSASSSVATPPDENGVSDSEGISESPKDSKDKAAGFRALLEKEQRDIRRRKKASKHLAGVFEEEASEEEDEAQEGIGEYGDRDKSRKLMEDEEERRIDNMDDEITAADLEGVVDAPSDNEGDDNVDLTQVHAKMMRDQDKREQEELIQNVQDGWANAGKRGGRRRRGQFDEGYIDEANKRRRKRLRLDGSEDEKDDEEEGLDEEDLLARRAERDAIRHGSDNESDSYNSDSYDEENGETFEEQRVDAEEIAERNAAAAVRRRAYRSQALRKQRLRDSIDIAQGGRGLNTSRQQSVVEDDDESQRILGLFRRHNDLSQHGLFPKSADNRHGYDASLPSGDAAPFTGIEAAGGGKNMKTLYAQVTAGNVGGGSGTTSLSSANNAQSSSSGSHRRPKSCEPWIGGMENKSKKTSSSSTNVFKPFRRTFSQMSSFRASSSSVSQHSWSSKSQTGSCQAMVNGGGKRGFVWRSESQSVSQFVSPENITDSNAELSGSALSKFTDSTSFQPFSGNRNNSRGKTPSTTTRGHRIVQNASLPAGLLRSRSSGSKRSATGGLFQALSAGGRFKKRARS